MHAGKSEVESIQADTDSKNCTQCQIPRPITNYRPTNYTLKDGTRIKKRRPICRQCERDNRLNRGVCITCTRPPKSGHTSCENCLESVRKSAKARAILDRQAAFQHYGQSCNYCGEIIEIFLTIDHIENNGAEHRRQINTSGRAGSTTYAWLRRNNYPDGFQTLCYNCNCAKGIYSEEIVKQALINL